MKNQNNVVEYHFEASQFQWEIAPVKQSPLGDLTSKCLALSSKLKKEILSL
jgi:hypothetical protein